MSQAWRDLGGRRRTLARQVYARDRAVPGYVCPGSKDKPCGKPIDWSLPYRDPDTELVNRWAKSVDHDEELQDGGDLTNIDNLVTKHLTCNASKGAARRHERTRETHRAQSVVIAVDPATL